MRLTKFIKDIKEFCSCLDVKGILGIIVVSLLITEFFVRFLDVVVLVCKELIVITEVSENPFISRVIFSIPLGLLIYIGIYAIVKIYIELLFSCGGLFNEKGYMRVYGCSKEDCGMKRWVNGTWRT